MRHAAPYAAARLLDAARLDKEETHAEVRRQSPFSPPVAPPRLFAATVSSPCLCSQYATVRDGAVGIGGVRGKWSLAQ